VVDAYREVDKLRYEEKLVESAIEKLEKSEVVITLNQSQSHNRVFVGDIAKLISIPQTVSYAMQDLAPVVTNYTNLTLTNGLEYIESCGGFKEAMIKLELLQGFAEGIIKTSNYNTFFSELQMAFQSLKGSAKQSYKRRYSPAEPLCCFCWREVNSSKNYCFEHHPVNNELEYKKVRNHMLRFFKLNKSNFSAKRLNIEISKRIREFVPQLNERLVTKEGSADRNWAFKAKKLVAEASSKYKLTKNKICHLKIDSFEKYSDFNIAVLSALSGNAVTRQDTDYFERDKHVSTKDLNRELAFILRLYEAHTLIMSAKLQSGPKLGSRRKLTEVRLNELKHILIEQKQRFGKTNYSEAGQKIGVSRQRISKMVKILELNQRE
jgi:hypothetical protein